MRHPDNRFARRQIEKKKSEKTKEDNAGKVRRQRKEFLKDQETKDDLRYAGSDSFEV